MERTISVQTEGRYFVKGELNKENKSIWFVFHGYGMKAERFIEEFDCIDDEQTLIVAPEGLHRFYARGTRGEVGSSWMTKELREYDIQNNIQYLNFVLQEVKQFNLSENYKIGVLGFSQGAPTAIRWIAHLEEKVSEIVIWGSDLPSDIIDNVPKLKKVNTCNIKLVVGSDDQYISSDQVDDMIIDLHDKGVAFDFHSFEGRHELHEESIRYFHARLVDEQLEY